MTPEEQHQRDLQEHQAVVSRWASSLDLGPLPEQWGLGFRLSTVPMDHWFYRRNRLQPDSITLDLRIPSFGLWVAELERHDDLFLVQWRPRDDLRIDAQQLKYTRLTPWPRLHALNEFPNLVAAVEACLGIRFIRHVDVSAHMIDTERLIVHPGIKRWLVPCADTVGHLRQASPGNSI